MVAERDRSEVVRYYGCSLAKISMVAELHLALTHYTACCSLAKISMVAEPTKNPEIIQQSCSLAKISMVAEQE